MIGGWQYSIVQPDLADWVTVAAYLLAAWLSVRAARQARISRQVREGIFWRITALLLAFLAINELLDLQTLLTSIGRAHAVANGWYGDHRRVQFAFVIALGLAAVMAAIALLWLTAHAHPAVRLALAGLVFIGMFVLVRAASFHHLDEILGGGAPGFNWGSVQEMVGILIVAAAAALYIRRTLGVR